MLSLSPVCRTWRSCLQNPFFDLKLWCPSGVSATLSYGGCPAECVIVHVEVPAATQMEGMAVNVRCEDVHIRIHNFSVPVRTSPHLLTSPSHRSRGALLVFVAVPVCHVHDTRPNRGDKE